LRFRLSKWSRGGVAAAAAVTITAGLMPFAGTAAHATTTVTVNTLSGPDRYATSAAIAEASYPSGVTSGTVVLATGLNFPDALAGSYLAGQLGAPVLLTPPTASDPDFPETTAALAKLLPATTKDVDVLGGTAAVGADVVTALQGLGYTVNRIAGPTRFDTAQLVDTQSGQNPGAGVTGNATAIIATGDNYPDALAAGPLAFAKHFPVILTDGSMSTLSPQAQSVLSSDKIKNVILMGGSAALNAGINTQLTSLGITIDKQLAGADRTDTAGQFWSYITSTYGFSTGEVILASGGNFPDALSAGAYGGKTLQGILLTEPDLTLGTYTTAVLTGASATITAINVVGGSSAVPTATVTAAQTAAQSAPKTQTSLPQLVSSSIVSTTTASQANSGNHAGTVVQFVENQALNGAAFNPAAFHVYPADDGAGLAGVPKSGYSGIGLCGISAACTPSTNPNAINVLFDPTVGAVMPLESTTGPDSASTLTLATIVTGATTNTNGQLSPATAVGIGAANTNAPQAGVTNAPDLVSISAPRAACTTGCTGGNPPANSSAIDLVFDKGAYPQTGGAGFNNASVSIVYAAPFAGTATPGLANSAAFLGQEAACQTPDAGNPNTGGTGYTVPGFNVSTDTVTVTCPNEPGNAATTLTSANIARIIVQQGAVGTAATPGSSDITNAMESSKSPHNPPPADAFPTPSLVGLTLTPGTTSTTPDVALFTFDTGVCGATASCGAGDTGVVPGSFNLIGQSATTYNYAGTFGEVGPCITGTPGATGAGAPACQVSSLATTLNVALYFPPGTFRNDAIVGANVLAGGVTTSNAPYDGNGDDELGAANSAAVSTAPGTIAAPQVTSATVTTGTNGLGQSTYTGVWTFDEAVCLSAASCPTAPAPTVAGTVGAIAFHLYDPDGTELTCVANSAGVGLGSADNTVGCANFNQGNTGVGTPATATQLAAVAFATTDYNAVFGNAQTGINNQASNPNPNPESGVSA
jgi:putative cell wall-binding protein